MTKNPDHPARAKTIALLVLSNGAACRRFRVAVAGSEPKAQTYHARTAGGIVLRRPVARRPRFDRNALREGTPASAPPPHAIV
jgi:hypothetical protein